MNGNNKEYDNDVVLVTVGGVDFSLNKCALKLEEDTMLGAMFSEINKQYFLEPTKKINNKYHMDRNAFLFARIVEFLNNRRMDLNEKLHDDSYLDQVSNEADFFMVDSLKLYIEKIKMERKAKKLWSVESYVYYLYIYNKKKIKQTNILQNCISPRPITTYSKLSQAQRKNKFKKKTLDPVLFKVEPNF